MTPSPGESSPPQTGRARPHTRRQPYSGSKWPAPSCCMNAKNASFSSGSASSSTGRLTAADSLLEGTGLFLRTPWVPEPKTFSVGQRGQKAAEWGWAHHHPPPSPILPCFSPWGDNCICVGHIDTGPCSYVRPINLGNLLKLYSARFTTCKCRFLASLSVVPQNFGDSADLRTLDGFADI